MLINRFLSKGRTWQPVNVGDGLQQVVRLVHNHYAVLKVEPNSCPDGGAGQITYIFLVLLIKNSMEFRKIMLAKHFFYPND